MFDTKTVILIREDTILPPGLSIASNAFFPGWRIVTSPDRSGFTRGIEAARWNFFYSAEETRATVLGADRLRTLRRAVKSILARQELRSFNSVEVTTIVSKRFLGIPFLRIFAYMRHIQESSALILTKDFVLKMPAAVAPKFATGGSEEHAVAQYATAK